MPKPVPFDISDMIAIPSISLAARRLAMTEPRVKKQISECGL